MRIRLVITLLVVGASSLTLVAALGASRGEPKNGQPIERHGIKHIHAAKRSAVGVSLHSNSSQGAVSPTPQVYLVFWGSQWGTSTGDPNGAAAALQTFFANLYGTSDTWKKPLDRGALFLAGGSGTLAGAYERLPQHPDPGPLPRRELGCAIP